MQVTANRISPVVMELAIEVPKETVTAEVERAYSALSKRAHIKGYRPGKVPRNVLKQMFAPQVANDVANNLVQNTLPKALSDNKLTPINQPSVEISAMDMANPFSYKARFEVQPELENVVFEGFELERPSIEVDEALVEKEIEGLRTRHAALKAPEPARPAKAGDVVTIDFTISIDGKEIKDGGAEGVTLELGAGQALPELDTALIGANLNQSVEAKSTFGADHPRKDFQNKTGHFKIVLKDLKEKVLPTLDDEFAKDVGSFQTLVELRADIHSRLEKIMKDRAETSVAEQIVHKLNEANPFEVPPSLVEAQARLMQQEVAQQLRRVAARFTNEQAKELIGKIQEDAEKKVRAGLVMATIAKKQEFKVTEEDIEKGLLELAAETQKNINKVRAEYREKQKRDVLVGMILEDKILDFLEGKSKIVDLPKGQEPKIKAALSMMPSV